MISGLSFTSESAVTAQEKSFEYLKGIPKLIICTMDGKEIDRCEHSPFGTLRSSKRFCTKSCALHNTQLSNL
jgi:hypothetical protein